MEPKERALCSFPPAARQTAAATWLQATPVRWLTALLARSLGCTAALYAQGIEGQNQVLATLSSYLETLGGNPLPSSFRVLPCGHRLRSLFPCWPWAGVTRCLHTDLSIFFKGRHDTWCWCSESLGPPRLSPAWESSLLRGSCD